MVSNSAAKSTWHEVSSHDNKPEIKSKYCNRDWVELYKKMYDIESIAEIHVFKTSCVTMKLKYQLCSWCVEQLNAWNKTLFPKWM